jgi:hypothetical protein
MVVREARNWPTTSTTNVISRRVIVRYIKLTIIIRYKVRS